MDLAAGTEPVMIKIQTFRNHLGRHLEQLALFVLPKQEAREQADDTVRSDAVYEGRPAQQPTPTTARPWEASMKAKGNHPSIQTLKASSQLCK